MNNRISSTPNSRQCIYSRDNDNFNTPPSQTQSTLCKELCQVFKERNLLTVKSRNKGNKYSYDSLRGNSKSKISFYLQFVIC